jgi:oligopeptide/dipeptide ABC transporter ATP-binding protein
MKPDSSILPPGSSPNVLEVRDLKVSFQTVEGEVRAVDGVSYCVPRGKVLAVVGESGCGKSVTAYSILRLIQKPGRIVGGSIRIHPSKGEPIEMTSLREDDELLYHVRGGLVSMIFQEPMTALSPVHTVGNQICEAILLHQPMSYQDAEARAIEMLAKVGIPGPEKRIHQYPFEMSGGMRQRVVIAMALVCNPELLIADEPTTALDVTIQAQIMDLMKRLKDDLNSAVLLITHNMGVVAQMADEVAVMYLGRVVEQGTVREVLKNPRHPYTQGLLASLPSLSYGKPRLPSIRGSVPSMLELPRGCPFHPRCPQFKRGVCDQGGLPPLRALGGTQKAACIRADEIPAGIIAGEVIS